MRITQYRWATWVVIELRSTKYVHYSTLSTNVEYNMQYRVAVTMFLNSGHSDAVARAQVCFTYGIPLDVSCYWNSISVQNTFRQEERNDRLNVLPSIQSSFRKAFVTFKKVHNPDNKRTWTDVTSEIAYMLEVPVEKSGEFRGRSRQHVSTLIQESKNQTAFQKKHWLLLQLFWLLALRGYHKSCCLCSDALYGRRIVFRRKKEEK